MYMRISNMLIAKHILKATNSSVLVSEKGVICVWNGEGGQTYVQDTTLRKKCELMKWPFSSAHFINSTRVSVHL